MKYQKILGLVATAGLLLAGCATDSDNNNTWLSDSNAVHVSASVGSIFTRSNPTDEAKQTSFNKDDVMGVSNNGKSLNYTFNGTDWQPGNESYLVWDNSNLTFQCWYPADGKNSFSKGYIQEDQSNATEIAKSDYMTAEKKLDAIPDSRKLEVALERKTARLILNIQSFNDQFDANTTKVNHIRIASNASTDASESSIVNIKPLQNGEGGIGTTYTALVMPGAIEASLYFKAEGTTETPLVVKTGKLEAGKSYTFQLTVGMNQVSVAGITVKDWTTGATIEGGKVTEVPPYVTFTAAEAQTFKMTTEGNYAISWLEYSLDGNEWTAVEEDKKVEFGGTKGSLRLRGKNLNGTASSSNNYSTITFTNPDVKVACTGDIRTLLDCASYKTVETKDAKFCNLFYDCTQLTSAPELPATQLASYCYFSMFNGCSSLEKASDLPAETLAASCYAGMFSRCSSLEKAPKLPATQLASYCYNQMFRDCTNLSSVTILASSDQIKNNYYSCFYWLKDAGTSAKSRKLIILDEAAYNELETNSDNLPDNWKIGSNCTVLDKDGKAITK